MTPDRLQQLLKLAKADKAAALGEVMRRRSLEDQIAAQAVGLAEERAHALQANIAPLGGGEVAFWSRWIDRAAERLDAMETKRLAAAKEAMAAEAVALEALGRQRAVDMLIALALREKRLKADRRVERWLEELTLAAHMAARIAAHGPSRPDKT
jgi:hypothetical protein